ncbi:hypothetical protein KY284_023011 [Solanum tuberosum]|nr:hypothetical protein KY284_023011 [Solanum tuberosum]
MPGSKFGYNKHTRFKQVLTSWKNANDPSPGPFTHEVYMENKYIGQGVNMWNHSVVYWNSGPWTGNNFTGPKFEKDWKLSSFSSGCMRKTSLNCGDFGEKDRFWMYKNMRLPTNNESLGVGNEVECESGCLEDCDCAGYAYGSGNIGCLIWKREMLNLQQLSQDNVNGSTIYVRLAASEFSSNQDQKQTSTKLKIAIPIGVIAALLILSCFTYIYYRKRRNSKVKESTTKFHRQNTKGEGLELIDIQDDDIEVPFFSFESILVATDDFSEQNKLGQGGFGPVYKGIFSGGREIALKRLSSHSGQGINEFKNEVMLIARLQHRNLVKLLGYCIQSSEKILLYEYMANKSLDTFIFVVIWLQSMQ